MVVGKVGVVSDVIQVHGGHAWHSHARHVLHSLHALHGPHMARGPIVSGHDSTRAKAARRRLGWILLIISMFGAEAQTMRTTLGHWLCYKFGD